MEHVVVIGKADKFAVRAENMHMAAAAQRAGCIGGGNIHRIEVVRFALPGDHAATMVEIVMPALIRVFRAVDKDIFIYRWMNGHHANVRALSCTVEDLNLSRLDIHPLDGFAGKRGARGTNVKDQPPAVRRPGARVGKLMMTGAKVTCFINIP